MKDDNVKHCRISLVRQGTREGVGKADYGHADFVCLKLYLVSPMKITMKQNLHQISQSKAIGGPDMRLN